MKLGICVFALLLAVACSDDQGVDCELSDLDLTVTGNENADCNAGANIELDASGGEPPYLYRFDGSPFQDLSSFEGLPLGGPFEAEVQDANGCQFTLEVSITGDENTVTFDTETKIAGCGTAEGSIEIVASGGDGQYTYRIEDGNFGDASSFDELEVGTYRVSVRDGTGCISVQGIQVLSGLSYESDVEPIIQASCATTGCHVSGTGRVDLTIFSNVQSNAISIRTRVIEKTMPKDGTLTNDEIDAIVCWIDDGALNN